MIYDYDKQRGEKVNDLRLRPTNPSFLRHPSSVEDLQTNIETMFNISDQFDYFPPMVLDNSRANPFEEGDSESLMQEHLLNVWLLGRLILVVVFEFS